MFRCKGLKFKVLDFFEVPNDVRFEAICLFACVESSPQLLGFSHGELSVCLITTKVPFTRSRLSLQKVVTDPTVTDALGPSLFTFCFRFASFGCFGCVVSTDCVAVFNKGAGQHEV